MYKADLAILEGMQSTLVRNPESPNTDRNALAVSGFHFTVPLSSTLTKFHYARRFTTPRWGLCISRIF
jgi:hypothetical protein